MNPQNEPCFEAREIMEQVSQRLKKYEGLNTLEQFAMFMGMAQLLELCLKAFLAIGMSMTKTR